MSFRLKFSHESRFGAKVKIMIIVKVRDSIRVWVILRASIRHMVRDKFSAEVKVGSLWCSGSGSARIQSVSR